MKVKLTDAEHEALLAHSVRYDDQANIGMSGDQWACLSMSGEFEIAGESGT